MRVFLSAFGQPGHAFPMLALGVRLVQRGHDVTFETWSRWREHVTGAGMAFLPAPEYPPFPTRERPLQPYQAVALAVPPTRAAIAARRPDVVVHDVLTLAPALAAELEGIPTATLVPHLYPVTERGRPPFGLGARPPRTRAGRTMWSAIDRPAQAGLRLGRDQLNELRARVGLAGEPGLHGGISRRLCLVATFPQLEPPRHWPSSVHVIGPLLWEPPSGVPLAATPPGDTPLAAAPPGDTPLAATPPGDVPLVVVAPSTSHDPRQRLLRAALLGLRHDRVRLLGVTNARPFTAPIRAGRAVRLVDWLRYSDALPRASLVICHAGHGTIAHALTHGVPVLAVPHSGDMAENAARLDWAGLGVRLPWRLLSPATLRLAAGRVLDSGGGGAGGGGAGAAGADSGHAGLRARAHELAAWARGNDAATRAAELIEAMAR